MALPTDIVGAEGTDEAAWLGYCVAVGDFNGDGREDIAAGMPGAEGRRGAVAIVYGGATGLNLRSPDLSTRTRLTAGALTEFTAAIGDQIGSAVAAGDFDGDGYTDLAIGAPCRAAGGSAGAGQVIIVYGDRGMGAARLLQRRQVVTQTGAGANEVNDHFGAALAAGDFNGDGYVDLAIGAPDEDLDQRASVGVVFIRFGSARGLTSEGYHYISAATRSPGTGANSTEAGERFGGILAAGPLHRPAEGRVDDLVVGAPGKDISIYSASAGFRNVNFANAGKVYVFEGARSAHTLRHRVDILPGTWPLGIEGFGSSLAIGDFDGDLNPDLAVGAPNAGDDTEHSGGRVYVMNYNPVNGSVGRRAFPDERNTQYLRQPDEVLSEVPIAKVENGDRYGFSLVAADFNGDSFFDLAVGAPWEDWNQANDTGLVFLLLGGSDGLSAAFGCTYSFLDQAPVGGNEAGDRFGFALAAGDIDGDESPDLVVGAPYEDRPASRDGGAVFLARTTTVAAGAFDGVWSGTIQGDNRTSATLRLFLCDRDGVVSGSGFLDDDLERDACGETVTL
ncbi:MAG: FG-GAP-like repeat-containing protein, partial [Nitrospira sp.]|nr:FG-GAP-like repeat-containing protein [Nitrospira sp.]